jgi:hypothetical protein
LNKRFVDNFWQISKNFLKKEKAKPKLYKYHKRSALDFPQLSYALTCGHRPRIRPDTAGLVFIVLVRPWQRNAGHP